MYLVFKDDFEWKKHDENAVLIGRNESVEYNVRQLKLYYSVLSVDIDCTVRSVFCVFIFKMDAFIAIEQIHCGEIQLYIYFININVWCVSLDIGSLVGICFKMDTFHIN